VTESAQQVPPYPVPDNMVLKGIIETALAKFETGEISVAGAIQVAAQTGWAVGHQEGEDLCLNCEHRVIPNLPARVFPHHKCISLTLQILESSLKVYIDTFVSLVNVGAVKYPQSEVELRAALGGVVNCFTALRMLSDQTLAAVKKGAT